MLTFQMESQLWLTPISQKGSQFRIFRIYISPLSNNYKMNEFNYKVKVFYEDTDAGGVVYYANYLKFFERARTEAIEEIGLSNKKLLKENGILIIVKSCKIEYKKPAKLEDQLEIKSSIISTSKTSFKMKQKAYKDQELITDCEIHLVIVDKKGKPSKIPNLLKKKLEINLI